MTVRAAALTIPRMAFGRSVEVQGDRGRVGYLAAGDTRLS